MEITPLHDRLVVKRLEPQQTGSGGIVIPETAAEKATQGKVIAIGSGKVLENGNVCKPTVKAGQRVLFGKFAGTEVEVDGDKLLILREDEVFGVIES